MLSQELLDQAMNAGKKLSKALDDKTRQNGARAMINSLKTFSTAQSLQAKEKMIENWLQEYIKLSSRAGVSASTLVMEASNVDDKVKLANAITGMLTGKAE